MTAPVSQAHALTDVLADLGRHEKSIAAWDADTRRTAENYRESVETLHREALLRLIRILKNDEAAYAALKEALSDEFVYAVLRRHGLVKPSLNERVEAALDAVRPMLASHGGDVELVAIAPPSIEVRFTGACEGCAASVLTFHAGVKKSVQEACPEITSIVQVKGIAGTGAAGFTSPFALKTGGSWLRACALADLKDTSVRMLEVAGEDVLLYRRGVAVTCFRDACAHLGFSLSEGFVKNDTLSCPYHGFRFNLTNGDCLTAPDLRLVTHAVRIVEGQVEIRLAE